MEEDQQEANDNFGHKFFGETDKHNKLLDEVIQVRENLKLSKIKFF